MDGALEKDAYSEIGENLSDSQCVLEEKLMGFARGFDICHPHFKNCPMFFHDMNIP